MHWIARAVGATLLVSTITASTAAQTTKHDYLFVWATDVGTQKSDFLAVIDTDASSPRYGEVIATSTTGVPLSIAHHTEHVMPKGGVLFANGFGAGQTFLFDLHDPLHPKVVSSFKGAGEFMHPHSFVREPNQNVLATYQMRGHENDAPGALVELSPEGKVLRISPAADPLGEPFIRPYSLAIVPPLDRVVTTSSDMHGKEISHSVQVWRLSDLKLLKTVRLPTGPRGSEGDDPAEPRVLADGRTVVVSTFNCGMFVLNGLEGTAPTAELVHSLPAGECALPVVSGRYWVATDTSIPGLVSLDMTNPHKPKEVSRLVLGTGQRPHWISLAPDGERIVISGGKEALETRVLMARIDRSTGSLKLDETFRDKGAAEPGVSFDRKDWPHGDTGRAIPHGAVFSLPSEDR
jgi:hypothetical protein